jgi:hypothetical protein
MSNKQPCSTHSSSRTTGNEPVEAIDPGGTRSTKPGQPDKTKPNAKEVVVEHHVSSGDRNTWRESRGPQPKAD